MPVDPQIQNLLSMMAANGAPGMAAGTVGQARDMFTMFTVTLRDPSALAPVKSTEDATIPGPGGDIPIRIYRPEAAGSAPEAGMPTMVFFHGGGFVIGNIETHDDHARQLCHDVGMVVVSVDYRLAPEHQWPAGFEDCLAATKWAAANIDSLGGDADKLLVGGDSAGGNLSAVVAIAARDGGPKLCAQYLIYPGVDFVEEADYPSRVENAEGYFLTAEDMLWFGEQYLPAGMDRHDPRASAIHAESLAGLPPAIIGTAEFDPLRDEGEAYAKALADAGVEVHVQRYDGMIHGFYGMAPLSEGAKAAVTDMTETLKRVLAG